jgi:phage-related protein
MARPLLPGEKPLHWVGSSLKDLCLFPAAVRTTMGFALSVAQYGGKHPSAKPWKGEGPGVLEIVRDHNGDTFRAVYTVRFSRAIYVLHAFQKKSPRGIATRRSDAGLIHERLKAAQRDYEERYA